MDRRASNRTIGILSGSLKHTKVALYYLFNPNALPVNIAPKAR